MRILANGGFKRYNPPCMLTPDIGTPCPGGRQGVLSVVLPKKFDSLDARNVFDAGLGNLIPDSTISTEGLHKRGEKLAFINSQTKNLEKGTLQGADREQEMMEVLLSYAARLFSPDASAVIIDQAPHQGLFKGIARGLLEAEMAADNGILRLAAENNHTFLVPDSSGTDLYFSSPAPLDFDNVYDSTFGQYGMRRGDLFEQGFKTILVAPLVRHGSAIAAMVLAKKLPSSWDPIADMTPARLLANIAAINLKRILEKA